MPPRTGFQLLVIIFSDGILDGALTNKPGTARMKTGVLGLGRINYHRLMIGSGTSVGVAGRVRSGGIHILNQGPGRQVQDKTYYQTELRLKLAQISEECSSLAKEVESVGRENANFAVFEKKYAIRNLS